MQQIKAIIADVDGVMVGGQEGFNFPLPHTSVIQALKQISAAGTPVVLCSAKFALAIKDIAIQAELDNPHIADGGALIIDWLGNKVVTQHAIDSEVVQAYAKACLAQGLYVELITPEGYYIQKLQVDDFTPKRAKPLQAEPRIVPDLLAIAKRSNILKMISFSKSPADAAAIEKNAARFTDKLHCIWSQHPFFEPIRPFIMTAPGVSKQHASLEVAAYLRISPDDILGIGDAESDWNFMQICGYVATVGSDAESLQQLAKSKGKGRYYFAGSVDDHGLLEVFRHFKLLPA